MASKRSTGDQIREAVNQDMDGRDLPKKGPETAEDAPGSTQELRTVSIRITGGDKRKLAAHFRRKYDVGLSTGIRLLLRDYMERERIR